MGEGRAGLLPANDGTGSDVRAIARKESIDLPELALAVAIPANSAIEVAMPRLPQHGQDRWFGS